MSSIQEQETNMPAHVVRLLPRFKFRFSTSEQGLDQDREWCEYRLGDGRWRRFRFHDYGEIYSVPGLYEAIFYQELRCSSPERVVGLLKDVLQDYHLDTTQFLTLDVGAGNGMVGEEVRRQLRVREIVGVDLLPEAKAAAERDRPGLYEEFHAVDLLDMPENARRSLEAEPFDLMTTVAALGFGDMPARAFGAAFNLVRDGGWVAFNVKEDFLRGRNESGFDRLIDAMSGRDIVTTHAYRRYCHRLSMRKEPIFYIAVVAEKMRDIPEGLLDEVAD